MFYINCKYVSPFKSYLYAICSILRIFYQPINSLKDLPSYYICRLSFRGCFTPHILFFSLPYLNKSSFLYTQSFCSTVLQSKRNGDEAQQNKIKIFPPSAYYLKISGSLSLFFKNSKVFCCGSIQTQQNLTRAPDFYTFSA